ncbi:1,6-anhydro-N-acetylmuramyl-L-alanine amidase AmpD [Methylomicrobium sp. Wu6]|uniref:1,6-anhydro-N-acetylmuramyl-L-alanine amidase AmpD n=1 Tax=Methylomicrobium sp. Wu6 TaxID=3107928 RepID=UPI002DD64E97|nr:1,6-anhydro-N-acetylmuramyl-L-alanine amidase AmpD [Methylomicrobium sp. Wu6]MEC4747861.1 1,6-anhydro-N-acetylmuramyl-L-alanine amidase AmpD [Methylomicrobium sp. Wu6]
MIIDRHWLSGVTRLESPNFDDRPGADDISLIVIHCISLPPGEFGHPYIDQLFLNRLDAAAHPYFESIHQLQVSAHLLIKRNGEITQYVPFDKRAWHAGASSYQGRERCNEFSIGIELEGTETTAYTDAQYRQLAAAITALLETYPKLSKQRIAGHSDIAPGRKTDPGATFDWAKLRQLLDPPPAKPPQEYSPIEGDA